MKLLKQEHNDLANLFESLGIHKGAYLLSKKAGWVRIYIDGKPIEFAYHHKKSSELVNGQFTFKVQYFVRKNNKESRVENWTVVLEQLAKHLANRFKI